MSTILKALRRLEEEKRSGGERPLREEVANPGPVAEVSRRPGRLPLLLAGVGVLCVAALVWSRWPDGGEVPGERDVAAQPSPAASAPVPTLAPARAPMRETAPTARVAPMPEPAPAARTAEAERDLPDDAFASDVAVVPRPAARPRTPIEIARASEPMPADAGMPPDALGSDAAAPTPAPRVAQPEPAPAPVVVAQPEPAPAPVVAQPEPAPAPVVAQPEPAPAPVVAARPAPRPAPAVAEPAPAPTAEPAPAPAAATPPTVSADASELSVERTLWHPSASRRSAFVAVDGAPAARVQEGDVLGRYVVSEIRPSGVLFLRDGKPLERKVGGSAGR